MLIIISLVVAGTLRDKPDDDGNNNQTEGKIFQINNVTVRVITMWILHLHINHFDKHLLCIIVLQRNNLAQKYWRPSQ